MGRRAFNFDWSIAVLLLCLSVFGLFLHLTIDRSLFLLQAGFFAVSFFLFIAISNIGKDILRWFAPFSYAVSVFFLLLPYFFEPIRGAARWITIGTVRLQPSELVKPLMILFFSWFISQYSPRKLKYLPLHVLVFLLPFFLVFRQPDLGTSLIYTIVWVFMMLAGGLSVRLFFGLGALGVVGLPFAFRTLASYQQARIVTFFNPMLDPRGAGYNAIQSVIAVGSGMVFGRGLGRGTQSHLRFLPEYHTDFVFATFIEEFGFVGGFVLLSLYALLLWRLLYPLISGGTHDTFPYLYSLGVFSMILSQMFINIAMNMGLIPVTGITLPLVSYGGSSLLSMSISLGMLTSLVQRNHKKSSVAIG